MLSGTSCLVVSNGGSLLDTQVVDKVNGSLAAQL